MMVMPSLFKMITGLCYPIDRVFSPLWRVPNERFPFGTMLMDMFVWQVQQHTHHHHRRHRHHRHRARSDQAIQCCNDANTTSTTPRPPFPPDEASMQPQRGGGVSTCVC